MYIFMYMGFPGGLHGKQPTCNAETCVQSLGWEDLLEEGMATHSSSLAGKIPWTEEPGRLCLWGCKELDMTKVTEQ